ncbi:MAG: NAD(P)H-dependent oxidoreductase [Spirochaetales bacterium]|nr:NAD(P)H-dependent oxidoreductase [Spirochaetales bacterium]
MLKTLIINGNPKGESFCKALAESYAAGAVGAGADVEVMHIGDMVFDPNLKEGYDTLPPMETDLKKVDEAIREAEHIVVISPTWWGAVPAQLKGLFDRILLPGVAFTFDPGKSVPRKLLAGRTARVIVTADAPIWYHRFVSGDPVVKVVKGLVLEFCGVAVTGVSRFGPIKGSADSVRVKWLGVVHVAGARDVTRSGAKRRLPRRRAA